MARKKKRREVEMPRLWGIPVIHFQHTHFVICLLGLGIGCLVSMQLDPHNGMPFIETPQRYIPTIAGGGLGMILGFWLRGFIGHFYFYDDGTPRWLDYDD